MAQFYNFPAFLAGIGVGVAATLLVKDHELRGRLANLLGGFGDVAGKLGKGERTMSDVKSKLKDKISDTAEGAKKLVDKSVDKSKEAAHKAGEHLERGGKRLQKV